MKLSELTDLNDYIKALCELKERYVIIMAVRDHCGTASNNALLLEFMKLGTKISLTGKGHKGYIAFLDSGELFFEKISQTNEPIDYKITYCGTDFEIVSKPYTNGDTAKIIIDGQNYAVNNRGQNIVVYDKYANVVIDSAAFDTFAANSPCKRGDTLDIALRRLNEMNAAGYSVAEYCLDSGITDIIVYIEKQQVTNFESVLLSFRMNPKIKVRYVSNEQWRFSYSREEEIGFINFADLKTLKLTEHDSILLVLPKENPKLEENLKPAVTLNLVNLLSEIGNVAYYFKQISIFSKMHPNIKVVNVLCPLWTGNAKTEWYKRICKENIDLKKLRNLVSQGEAIPVFDGYSAEESMEMLAQPPSYLDERGIKRYADFNGKNVTCSNGHRITTNQPGDYEQTVFVLGSCQTFGIGVPDSSTVASYLQKEINNGMEKILVENYGSYNWSIKEVFHGNLFSLPVRSGDIVLFVAMPEAPNFVKINQLNVRDCFNGSTEELWIFLGHRSANAHKLIAKAVYMKLNENNFYRDNQQTDIAPLDIQYKLPFGVPQWAVKNHQIAQMGGGGAISAHFKLFARLSSAA